MLILAVVAAAIWTVRSHWVEVRDTITEMSWREWVPSFLALPVAIGLSTLSWQFLVDELGERVGFSRGAQIFLVGQLGKYLPGSVWAYVLQMELGRRAGLARARVFTATLFSLAVAVVAALLCGVLAIPSLSAHDAGLEPLRWLYVLLPVGLICLHPRILNRLVSVAFRILRRPPLDHPVRLRAVVCSLLAAVVRTSRSGCTSGCWRRGAPTSVPGCSACASERWRQHDLRVVLLRPALGCRSA